MEPYELIDFVDDMTELANRMVYTLNDKSGNVYKPFYKVCRELIAATENLNQQLIYKEENDSVGNCSDFGL